MCEHCDYGGRLASVGLEATDNRIRIMEVVGANNYPLTAAEIHEILDRSTAINRVTVYRILDLLVEKKMIEQIRMGGRAAHYGLAPNANHAPHHHFLCSRCGAVDCLPPESLSVNISAMEKTFPGRIDKVEVQVEGVCRRCLKQPGADQ